MTDISLRLTPEAHRAFTALAPEVKKRIKTALRKIVAEPSAGKALQGELAGYRSYRTRRYRIVYRFNESGRCIEVLHFGHRRSVYEQLHSLLKK